MRDGSTPNRQIDSPSSTLSYLSPADIVVSLNGRDAGKRFIVIGTENEYSLIADGKGRRYEKPKRKKNKHLKLEGKVDGQIANKLTEGEKATNNEIRRALAAHTAPHCSEGGMQKCPKTT